MKTVLRKTLFVLGIIAVNLLVISGFGLAVRWIWRAIPLAWGWKLALFIAVPNYALKALVWELNCGSPSDKQPPPKTWMEKWVLP